MKQIYDWESNTLNLLSPEGYRFSMKFRGDKTIVSGASASGKTLLCNMIRSIANDLNRFKLYSAGNIFIADFNNKEKIKEQEGKFIVIDRADLILNDEIVMFINSDCKNRYLLFSRKSMGIKLTPNYFAEMQFDGDTFGLRYLFNAWGWY